MPCDETAFTKSHRRTGRGGRGGGQLPLHFSGSLRFRSGILPEKHPTLPEFSVDFQNLSKFWGASPPDPPFNILLRIFDKNSKSLPACKKFTCVKNRLIRAFWNAIRAIGWLAPPLKISPCAYAKSAVIKLATPSCLCFICNSRTLQKLV